MSLCFRPFILDATDNSAASVPAARDNPDTFQLSLSNANGIDLLLALGLAPEPTGESYTLDAFAGLVTAALQRHLGKRSPARPATVRSEPGGITMVFAGRREGYVEARLGDLAELIQRGRAAGATHFSWS